MSFILYVVVLVVSVTSVMMGLDWLSTPPPPLPKSVQTVRVPPKPAAPPVAKEVASAKTEATKSDSKQSVATTGKASPTTVAKVETTQQPDVAATRSETAGSAPASAVDNRPANALDGMPTIMTEEGAARGAAAQANAPVPRCDVQACSARYRTFTASDCTYQPLDGPRRLCTVGNPPKQADAKPADVQTSDASKPPASSSCNVDACAAAYRSFDAATCTWQPFEGPRRQCTK